MFRKTVQSMDLRSFIRQALTFGIKDIRESIKELKDMARDMEIQSRELDRFSEEQLRALFAGELVDGFDKLVKESAEALEKEVE